MSKRADTSSPKKYAAFISYRHMSPDKEIARALQKMLEHNLVRPNKKAPRNIRPVFLDTGELPLLEDLDAGILQALENSECLFVICSPNLPLSKYCMREISYFKELHSGSTARIYTLLVAGEPAQSFPEVLRTSTRIVHDENGDEHTEPTFVEPLFADVRAPTIRESIRKLRKTEHLRLAAAYYGCSYDSLYQRRKRWLWKVGMSAGAIVAAAALGFGFYVHTRNLQYNAAQAATFASYAREENTAGDELLAITLCKDSWDAAISSGSNQYMTALRSAAVQHDYKHRALPVSAVMEASYLPSANSHLYVSQDEAISIVHSDNIYQFNDAKTGALLQQQPQDTLRLNQNHLTYYVTIGAQADENGVLWDTVSFWSLEEHRLVNSFPICKSGTEYPSYQLNSYIDVPGLLSISDDQVEIAWLDMQGNQLTREEASRLMVENHREPEAADAPFYYTIGNKFKRASIKNQAGEAVLTLEDRTHLTAFSPDYSRFAYLHEDALKVYDTAAWTLLNTVPISPGSIQALHLLQDSSYALLTYRSEDSWWYSLMVDWRSGTTYGPFGGYADISGMEPYFYSTDNGVLTRYHYNDLDLTQTADVIDQHGSLCLLASDTQILLADADTGRTLMQADFRPKRTFYVDFRDLAQASDDFSHILVNQSDGLHCYDQNGALLWQAASKEDCFALSMDGKTAAWVNEQGAVTVASAVDGAPLYTIDLQRMAPFDDPICMAVSSDGLYISAYNANFDRQAMWFPAGSAEGTVLEDYRDGTLYPNGLLVLERSSYVKDFAVWDVKKQTLLYQPTDNTGAWSYSPHSGYLVRRLETSNDHGTLELEILAFRKDTFEPLGRLPLPSLNVTNLRLDSTGEVLSVTAGLTTMVYRLPGMTPLLETTDCPLYYEDGRFWCAQALGGRIYSVPLLEGEALHQFAMDFITSPAGVRELSLEERSRYSFDQ